MRYNTKLLFSVLTTSRTIEPIRAASEATYGLKPSPERLANKPRGMTDHKFVQQNARIYHGLKPRTHEIRLINLLPSQRESDVIKCETFYGEWDSARYEALSYAWDSTSLKCPINIDGQKFMITENLFRALKRLRNPLDFAHPVD
jgi:hypothetical protein